MALLKFLHVLGAVLLLGNVVVTGLWAHWALARREAPVDAFAAKAVMQADLVATLGGGMLLTVPGTFLVLSHGIDWWQTAWLRDGVLLLVASTGLWLGVLLPDQWRMLKAAEAGDRPALMRAYRRWAVLGWGATGLLVAALYAMVAKY